LRAGGTAKGKYHFGNDESKLEKYAWFDKNSGGTTHPVGYRLPLIIDGRRFHDVIGNVWEWGWDRWSYKLPRRKNPGYVLSSLREKAGFIGPLKNPVYVPSSSSEVSRVVRGGGWSNSARHLRSAVRNGGDSYSGTGSDVGFRLVRTIPNP
ncbi:MAG: SUMF1/EgtB/PvdO family nonheme iron enzyme, partial [Bacteriovoracales bacterium]|nr:SUMF1/EgtB/PvdO family nonheme iron enzyme [Bacteriovoracales bacterium]